MRSRISYRVQVHFAQADGVYFSELVQCPLEPKTPGEFDELDADEVRARIVDFVDRMLKKGGVQ